ncbi:MAG: DHH family phosphoesterase [Gammaproteobacteria bacterium]
MRYIDVFNGDADGICALVQLRRHEPRDADLVTGIKRDVNLLRQVQAETGDHITVLDIAMEKNESDVKRLLDAGAEIFYADHHNPGKLLKHDRLTAHIDLSATTCTALIIDRYLDGRYRTWAITAAFGDNLIAVAKQLAEDHCLSETETRTLQELGIYLNYNGYGASVDDLFFHPAELYRQCVIFDTPFDFMTQNSSVFETLAQGYQQDMAMAEKTTPFHVNNHTAVILLPDEKWARRVSGVYGNELANRYPDRAHAIITDQDVDHYLISVRAPLNQKCGADEVVRQFPTGGGRQTAAGINALPKNRLGDFILALEKRYQMG